MNDLLLVKAYAKIQNGLDDRKLYLSNCALESYGAEGYKASTEENLRRMEEHEFVRSMINKIFAELEVRE